MNFIIQICISALAVLVTAYLLPGVHLEGENRIVASIVVAAVLAFLNSIVKPVMIALSFPVTVVTLGLFLLVINAVVIMIADKLIDSFKVDSFGWALLFSIVMWLVTNVFEQLRKKDKRANDDAS
jgi:putative membrane protein